MPNHFKKYCEYIRNTSYNPLPSQYFDDDWEPIGPMVRRDMKAAGLITEDQSGIVLTQAGEALMI